MPIDDPAKYAFWLRWDTSGDSLYARGELSAATAGAYPSETDAVLSDIKDLLQAMEDRILSDFRSQVRLQQADTGNEVELPDRSGAYLYPNRAWRRFIEDKLKPVVEANLDKLLAPVSQKVEETASNPVQ